MVPLDNQTDSKKTHDQQERTSVSNDSTQKLSKPKTVIYIIGLIIVILALSFGIYVYIFKHRTLKEQPSSPLGQQEITSTYVKFERETYM